MPKVGHIATLAKAPTGSTSPDSITLDNGFLWVAYTNGADSTGKSGHSTVVEYDPSGKASLAYQSLADEWIRRHQPKPAAVAGA